jgi:hypothetical protein
MPLRRITFTLLPCALVLHALVACAQAPAAAACGYQPVPLAPLSPQEFAGSVAGVQVSLHSERADPAVESFPDSDLQIRRAGARCAVDGGVWQRRGVFVAGDGQTVAAIESSGSNDMLVFISSADCRRRGQIDVSNSRWRFVDRAVEVTPAAGADRTPRRHGLDTSCRPGAPR